MKVYALVGKSGTGKSYQATNLCRELNIDGIIDDGLFIYGNDIVAGTSAKRQRTKVGAIKTAIFMDEQHRMNVIDGINKIWPDSILIIGTSDEMVKKIDEVLKLPEISKTIYIEDITTEKERNEALKQRLETGKHVIPAPSFQLKRDFSGYFMDPLKIFRTFERNKDYSEKAVVRPTYSYRGDYTISEQVLMDIVHEIASEEEQVREITRVDVTKLTDGIKVRVGVVMVKGANLVVAAVGLQKDMHDRIEYMTAFNVIDMFIDVRGTA